MEENWEKYKQKIMGLGDESFKKSYYPELQAKIAELESVNSNLQTIFDSTSDGIVIHDKFGKILSINKKASEMLNINKDSVTDFSIADFFAKDINFSELYSIWEEVLKGKTFSIESTINQNDTQKQFFVHLAMNRAFWYGKDVVVAILSDFTQRIKYENELIIAKSKAEESDRLKTEFLRNISHEIRTPMNGIIGFANLVNRPDISEKDRSNFVSIILKSGNRLMRIIDDILEISKLGAKQVGVDETQVNIFDLLSELYGIYIEKAQERGIELLLKKEVATKKCLIYTDRQKLMRIINNLLENAIRFTHEGYVEFGCGIKNNQVEIYVKDTGIGVELEKQKIIFERFSQAEKGLTRKIGGLGLGLAIAKENALLLGGDIRLESEAEEGSTFFVLLPYKPVISQDEIEAMKQVEVAKKDKYTILVVEDEDENYFYIETLFKIKLKHQYQILHVENGLEAVEICKANPEIDFVLMDLKIPIIDGYEAAEKIKEIRPDLPIIAQSAYASKDNKAHAAIAGCNDFIAKPISLETFSKIIEKYLSE